MPYVNKIQTSDGEVLLDLTDDTITSANLLKNVRAHDSTGAPIVGELETGDYNIQSESNGDGTQTLKITTVGSGATATDPMIVTKTFEQATSNSSTSGAVIFSYAELKECGILGTTGTLSTTWENMTVELRAVYLNSHSTYQFLRAYISNAPTLQTEDTTGESLKVSVYHNSSATSVSYSAMYSAITTKSGNHLYTDGSYVRLSVNSQCVLKPGTYVATIMVWGRKQ